MKMHTIAGLTAVACVAAALGYGLTTSAGDAAPAAQAAPATTATPTPPTPEETFNTECSACHMPYPAQFLPARSWQAITGDLANHFGEDASLDPATTKVITDYLVANAADSRNGNPRLLRGISATDTPLRITETRWWIRSHGEVSASQFAQPNVKSKSNCIACHRNGNYSDD